MYIGAVVDCVLVVCFGVSLLLFVVFLLCYVCLRFFFGGGALCSNRVSIAGILDCVVL